jgi:NhaP-type Na+/H+ or K+/H+ antiporter
VQLSDLVFALIGAGALLAGILPRALERRPLSMPIAFLALGMIVFALPLGLPKPDPLAATVGLVVLVSVVAHGVAATPVMRLLDRFNERTESPLSVTEAP